jgi:CheY-like chemotaxis protein
VLSALDGKEALGLLRAGMTLPDLIICDYRLGADELGTDVVRTIRARTKINISAVIISADAGAALQEATAVAGLHLMHKPLNAARLRAFLTHVAGMRENQGITSPADASHDGIKRG